MNKFIISGAVLAILNGYDCDGIVNAVMSSRGQRVQTKSESLGTRNVKKTGQAESGEVTKFTQDESVVTAFEQWGEYEVGSVDKLIKRAAKIGCDVQVDIIPVDFAGYDLKAWLSKFKLPVAPVPPVPAGGGDADKGKGKGKAPKVPVPAVA